MSMEEYVDSPELLLLSSPLHSVKNASSLSLRCLSPAATSGEETFDFDFCISRQMSQALDRDQLEQHNAATSATPWTYLNTWENQGNYLSIDSEIDQLYKIYCILGMPDSTCFTIGANNSRRLDFVGHEVVPPMKLSDIIPNASTETINLITICFRSIAFQLLSWDPSRRPDADQSLQHPFFHVNTRVPRSLSDPFELKLSNKRAKPNLELKLHDFVPDPDDCFLGLTLAVKPSVSNLGIAS
ncbi:cyclin-dependent kinase F-4 [Trifolium repens]|nr:cyclin-dependent kinase F-4 [Trifolium repens]